MDFKDDTETLPINSLDDLLTWNFSSEIIKKKSFYDLESSILTPSNKPMTLICHDFMNGYQGDRFDQGCGDYYAFNFWYWQNIDVFVYFSHHFISIPPFVWRVAAHKNNCRILGTLDIEGIHKQSLINRFLSPNLSDKIINNLVQLCIFYQFDGYLLNIETEVDLCSVYALYNFISSLRTKLSSISSNFMVIWYDSVINNGHLDYQNAVNSKNERFFESATIFYTNYDWQFSHLMYMKDLFHSRLSNIFLGIDLCQRKETRTPQEYLEGCLKRYDMAKSFDMSVAFFAISYIYEAMGKSQFYANLENFWERLNPKITERTLGMYPFYSSFCIGRGKQTRFFGEIVSTLPFCNISLQQIQPSLYKYPLGYELSHIGMNISIGASSDDSFIGGSSLLVDISIFKTTSKNFGYARYKLFSTNIKPSTLNCILLTIKRSKRLEYMSLGIELVIATEFRRIIFLYSDSKTLGIPQELVNEPGVVVAQHFLEDAHCYEIFNGGLTIKDDWIRLFGQVDASNSKVGLGVISEINLIIIPHPSELFSTYQIYIGEFGMINRDSLLSFDWSVFKISNITTENITYFHNNNLIISLILSWVVKIKKGSKNLIDSLDIFAFVDEEFKYIGKSMAKGRYYVNYHTKIKDLSELKLYLQIVLRSGMRRPIHQCPYTTIYFD